MLLLLVNEAYPEQIIFSNYIFYLFLICTMSVYLVLSVIVVYKLTTEQNAFCFPLHLLLFLLSVFCFVSLFIKTRLISMSLIVTY
jgi:hypothetical protein